jgi:hypothetical protein
MDEPVTIRWFNGAFRKRYFGVKKILISTNEDVEVCLEIDKMITLEPVGTIALLVNTGDDNISFVDSVLKIEGPDR